MRRHRRQRRPFIDDSIKIQAILDYMEQKGYIQTVWCEEHQEEAYKAGTQPPRMEADVVHNLWNQLKELDH